MVNPVRHARQAVSDLKAGTSAAVMLGLAALAVASVALIIALRKD